MMANPSQLLSASRGSGRNPIAVVIGPWLALITLSGAAEEGEVVGDPLCGCRYLARAGPADRS